MNKNNKWLVAISLATVISANGVAMAAQPSQQRWDAPDYQRPGLEDRGDFRKDHYRDQDGRRQDRRQEFSQMQKDLLKLLKMDERTFQAEIKSGKSLVDIAKKKGVSERTLKNFMVDQLKKRIDEAVKADRISQNQAKQMKAKLAESVTKMINRKGFDFEYNGIRDDRMFDHGKLCSLFKMDERTFRDEMKSGRSIAAIAKKKGISEWQLRKFMVEQMTQRINDAVKQGRISYQQAQEMKGKLSERAGEIINGKTFIWGDR